jgi:hypothetical protein
VIGAPVTAIPGVCFDEQTMITRISRTEGKEQIKITDSRPGDVVLTSDYITKELRTTLVTDNLLIQEESPFIKLTFSYDDPYLQELTRSIETTEKHVMIVKRDGKYKAKLATKVKIGEKVLTSIGEGSIIDISTSKKMSRVQLSTQDGTIIANDVLTTSYCSGQLEYMEKFSE